MRWMKSDRRTATFLGIVAPCLLIVAGLSGCALRSGRNQQPSAPPTGAALQPQAQPQQPQQQQPSQPPPTAAAGQPVAPTEAVQPPAASTQAVQSDDPQGDEVEQLLDQLDQENKSADPLNDVPQ